MSPKTASVKAGESQQFTASTDPTSATDITWEVAGGTKAGTVISSSGLLTVDATETAGTDKLTITYKGKVNGTDVTDTAKVTVTAP